MNIIELLKEASRTARYITNLSDSKIRTTLKKTAERLLEKQAFVLDENRKDLLEMELLNPKYDRLELTSKRLHEMAEGMETIAGLPSPLGKKLSLAKRPNGMVITKISVPLGVVGVIYESRPNVTFDVFAICLKSGNVCVLKGGSEAARSNEALVSIIQEVLAEEGLPPAICTLLPSSRDAATALLNAVGRVDVVIPRGGASLISYVRERARVPVIETGAGVCHVYFDKDGDAQMAESIVSNAKTRRVSVCNALDCLIIHSRRLESLKEICGKKLQSQNVEIYADLPSYFSLSGHYPPELLKKASIEHYGYEFLDYKMSIKTVASFDEALDCIAMNGSKHSECIVSSNMRTIRKFQQNVDAACIYANASTAFTDGGQFGFGGEIGISTQKLHARGPMSLPELTTYKYLIKGSGQIRPL
ncbi:MAG: glutamate-5-semialdehyde dehydrogenase [Tannerellaceae bacterium]|jgi:glutamate-5-semialdehyde dehydrogenase|nr:glutamate-5-semialdehyde dehydrogenase [Tannerellaceae bacterium]